MKILIPIPGAFGKQGGWRVLSELSTRWIDQGNEVVFLAHKSSDLPYFPTTATIMWYDNEGNISEKNDVNYRRPFLSYYAIAFSMIKILNKQNADIVLATLSLSALPIFLSKIKGKRIYYVQAYEPDFFKGFKPNKLIQRFLSKLSYYLGFSIISNSELYFNYKGIKTNRCVYPGIDFSIFKPTTNKIINKNKTIIIGTIGRVEKNKGTHIIIEAFKKIKKKTAYNIELHVAFGEERLNKIEGVKVMNFKGDDNLSKYYNTLDLYICAVNHQQGAVHYPVIESMACGVPVITTNFLPANEDNAWMIPINNTNKIVEQIKCIIENIDLVEKKRKIALNDIKKFDWNLVSKKMIDYFDKI